MTTNTTTIEELRNVYGIEYGHIVRHIDIPLEKLCYFADLAQIALTKDYNATKLITRVVPQTGRTLPRDTDIFSTLRVLVKCPKFFAGYLWAVGCDSLHPHDLKRFPLEDRLYVQRFEIKGDDWGKIVEYIYHSDLQKLLTYPDITDRLNVKALTEGILSYGLPQRYPNLNLLLRFIANRTPYDFIEQSKGCYIQNLDCSMLLFIESKHVRSIKTTWSRKQFAFYSPEVKKQIMTLLCIRRALYSWSEKYVWDMIFSYMLQNDIQEERERMMKARIRFRSIYAQCKLNQDLVYKCCGDSNLNNTCNNLASVIIDICSGKIDINSPIVDPRWNKTLLSGLVETVKQQFLKLGIDITGGKAETHKPHRKTVRRN